MCAGAGAGVCSGIICLGKYSFLDFHLKWRHQHQQLSISTKTISNNVCPKVFGSHTKHTHSKIDLILFFSSRFFPFLLYKGASPLPHASALALFHSAVFAFAQRIDTVSYHARVNKTCQYRPQILIKTHSLNTQDTHAHTSKKPTQSLLTLTTDEKKEKHETK